MIKGILLDVGGVVYVGETALHGAVEAVARLRHGGLALRCITNTTRTPLAGIVERLRRMGLEVEADDVFTPARAARAHLEAHGLSPHLLIHPALEPDLAGLSGTEGEAVVVGDAGDGFSYAAMNAAFRKLMAGAGFIALAANRMFMDDDNELSIDCGAFVAALEYATGREALVLGKPAPGFFRAAAESMGCGLDEVAMIGDDAEADSAGALAACVTRAVLVRTGKYLDGDEIRFDPRPTAAVPDLSDAADWILDNRD
ncbi:MAG: TIGR01458 family HAD-type hydrolase [Hyphomicrobiales bacterium]